jgi:surfeit locus 1 family protein
MTSLAFRLGRGTFTIRPIPTLVMLLILALLVGLGCWQVQRLHWKENLLADIGARMQEEEIDIGLSSMPNDDISQLDYHPAQATGVLQNAHEIFLIAVSKKGEGGYHVLTPMQMEDGRMLLVDRGWIPYDDKDPATRAASQFKKPVTIHGILRLAQPRRWPQLENNPAAGEWYRYDFAAMADAMGVKQLLPFALEADDMPNPDRFPVGGQTRVDLPNNHFVYALTWFGLAFVLLVIYGISSWHKLPPPAPKKPAGDGEETPESS